MFPPGAGLVTAEPPKIFVLCCGEVDDTELDPKMLAGVVVVEAALALRGKEFNQIQMSTVIFILHSTYMVAFDLSPNKFVGCAELVEAPPKIDAAVFCGDETLVANEPNEVDPNRPLLATNLITKKISL